MRLLSCSALLVSFLFVCLSIVHWGMEVSFASAQIVNTGTFMPTSTSMSTATPTQTSSLLPKSSNVNTNNNNNNNSTVGWNSNSNANSNSTSLPPSTVFTPIPQVNSPVVNRSIFKDSWASPSFSKLYVFSSFSFSSFVFFLLYDVVIG
ncbi:hypothetical protein HMI55_006901 [Coelomomyces lativittatus]|nr:hypothetical protein HMI56_007047 [Coelomomyces lativittatus]KAJ1510670.1 hypothetical protein HMI55_006901 [Coelomomyces lativittatus]